MRKLENNVLVLVLIDTSDLLVADIFNRCCKTRRLIYIIDTSLQKFSDGCRMRFPPELFIGLYIRKLSGNETAALLSIW